LHVRTPRLLPGARLPRPEPCRVAPRPAARLARRARPAHAVLVAAVAGDGAMRNAAERIESPAGIRCPVCGAPPAPSCEWHPAARAKPTCPCVVRCRGCGHRFRPRPDDALVRGTVYDARYHDGRQT